MALLAVVATLLAAEGIAQSPGDAIVVGKKNAQTAAALIAIDKSGATTTLYPGTVKENLFGMVEMAPGNRAILFSEEPVPLFPSAIQRYENGKVTPLWTGLDGLTDFDVDQGGDLVAIIHQGRRQSVLRRDSATGRVTTLGTRTTPGVSYAFGLEEDLRTGDWLVFTTTSELLRLRPDGSLSTVSIVLPVNAVNVRQGYVRTDFSDGSVLVAFGQGLIKVDPRTGAVTSLRYSTASTHYNTGLDRDPYGFGYYFLDGQFPLTLTRYDPGLNLLVPQFPLATRGYDVVSYGARHLSGLDRPRVGRSYRIQAGFPGEAGRFYLAAASTGALGGFRLPDGRRVPLDPDPLFFLSLVPNPIFVNFQGVLDSRGEAVMTVNIPNLPIAGLRLFLAAVTLDATGIRTISLPFGMSVER